MPRILLIEDNPANLELMTYLLGAFGYSARTATDGLAGLAAAVSEPFDLIVCDINMPGIDGCAVARRLKADPARQHIPLVAVTALAMVGDRDKVLAAGFNGYIAKPIDPETFVRQVEAFLPPAKRKSVAAPPPPAATSAGPSPAQPARCTILVVDNRAVNLELARSILEPHGYRVLTAGGVAEGLALAQAQPCDLIVSDVCMADGSGYDLIRAVKTMPPLAAVPFVFLTSTLQDEKHRAEGLALGAARYLFRPIEPTVLLAEIASCLRERAAHGNHPDR